MFHSRIPTARIVRQGIRRQNGPVRDADVALRNVTYRLFVELGRAPVAGEVAAAVGVSPGDVHGAWRRLSDAHAVVLQSNGTELRMASPFSAVPTPFRV